MDRFQQMRTFVAVVDARSFVGAGEALSMSRAAVSRHVGNLETRLGVRLLHRTTRTLSLTDEGQVFLARCRELLGELEEYEAEVTSRSGRAAGLLRANAPVAFGLRHLADFWGEFQAAHPRVTLDITLSDRLVDVVEEGYDVAIRVARLANSTLISRRLSTTRLVLCASPTYLDRAGTPSHPAQLVDHAVWAYSYFAPGDDWPFEGPDGPITARVRPTLRTNNGETCLAGALQHRCIVLQPSFLVGPSLQAGDLVELMPEYRSLELGIHALYPSRRHVAPKVRLLIDFLATSLADRNWSN